MRRRRIDNWQLSWVELCRYKRGFSFTQKLSKMIELQLCYLWFYERRPEVGRSFDLVTICIIRDAAVIYGNFTATRGHAGSRLIRLPWLSTIYCAPFAGRPHSYRHHLLDMHKFQRKIAFKYVPKRFISHSRSPSSSSSSSTLKNDYFYPGPARGTGYCFRAISFFVSMLARLRENGWTDLHDIFRECVEWP